MLNWCLVQTKYCETKQAPESYHNVRPDRVKTKKKWKQIHQSFQKVEFEVYGLLWAASLVRVVVP